MLERRAALCVSVNTEDLGFYSRQESVRILQLAQVCLAGFVLGLLWSRKAYSVVTYILDCIV